MNIKRSKLVNQDLKTNDIDNLKDYPTLADLMREQNVSSSETITVHHRRDLDSLG